MPLLARPSSARWFFDRLAPAYDRINARIYREEWLERVRAEIHGGRVLDVGVGTGFTTRHLESGVGIDLSREMLRRARYRGDLVRADVLRAPFHEGWFDTIVLAGSFYYLPDPAEGMRTVAGLLRPGGSVVILAAATRLLAPFVHIFDHGEYARLLDAAGLRLARYERLSPAACLVVGRKDRDA